MYDIYSIHNIHICTYMYMSMCNVCQYDNIYICVCVIVSIIWVYECGYRHGHMT